METRKAPSELLEGVVFNHRADNITFSELKTALHERGFGILMVVFSLPLAIPMPYPPFLPTLLVIPVFMFSLQMMLGMDSPWLPKWLGEKTIKRSTLAVLIEKASPYLKRVEKLLKARLPFTTNPVGERVIGAMCFLCAVSIALPIPFGNLIPGVGTLLMALGLMSRDGLVVLIGVVIGALGLALSVFVVLFGAKAVLLIFPWLIHAEPT